MINRSRSLCSGGNKFQLMLILPYKLNKMTEQNRIVFQLWTFYLLILVVTCSLTCNFESWCWMSCYFRLEDFCINAQMIKFWTKPVAIFRLLCIFSWSPFKGHTLKSGPGPGWIHSADLQPLKQMDPIPKSTVWD